MANIHYSNVIISGICSVVPERKIRIDDESEYYPDINKIERLKSIVGIEERTVCSENTTPTDLMEYAARKLLADMYLDPLTIDALICVLDYPDYRCPPSSCILQGKLGFSENCVAFDINHGCAGYIHGLNVAHALIQSGYTKVLLLVGDTKSKTINIKDRMSAPIFGDGASATLLERTTQKNEACFVLGTDGKNYKDIMIPAGGAKLPYSLETSVEKVDEFGNIRSMNNFYMNGRNVFNFTMSKVPKNINEVLGYAQKDVSDIDYFILHQANKSIIQNIISRIGECNLEKAPTSPLKKYGNLAVASIPNAISEIFSKEPRKERWLLLCGFGVGLSYGSAVIQFNPSYLPKVFIYKEK